MYSHATRSGLVLIGLLLMLLVTHRLAASVLNDEQRVEYYDIVQECRV